MLLKKYKIGASYLPKYEEDFLVEEEQTVTHYIGMAANPLKRINTCNQGIFFNQFLCNLIKIILANPHSNPDLISGFYLIQKKPKKYQKNANI